jgi:hypothetical protein
MRPKSLVITALFALSTAASFSSTSGCGGSGNPSHFGNGDDGGSSSGSNGGSSSGLFGGDGGGSSSGGSSGGGTAQCPSGTQCNVSCSNGGTTTISGTVYDPAAKNPLYGVVVYVPGGPLQPLPTGLPTGSAACDCAALFPSGAVVSTTTGVDGSFKLANAPVGASVPLVLQIGKWRRAITVDTSMNSCGNTVATSLSLPGTLAGAGPNDSMPHIAVSTGSADTLECLMRRIGLPDSEYIAGPGTPTAAPGAAGYGHVHVFRGGDPNGGKGGGGGSGPGKQEAQSTTLATEPESDTNLWNGATGANLTPYDILLLSCEGGETYNANPQALEAYLDAGGRAFGSHFHYSWFAGTNLPGGSKQAYTPPMDWDNLATWTAGSNSNGNTADGKIVQTLNGSTAPFPKGQYFYQWLGLVNALGVNGAPPMELPFTQPRYNAVVGPNNKPSQPWINDAANANTMYFSFDTPIGGKPNPDGGAPLYCGRAVFSDLHVAGPISMGGVDTPDPPTGCANIDLSPQEKALEFMLFDLSSCVIPDTVAPPDGGGILQ